MTVDDDKDNPTTDTSNGQNSGVNPAANSELGTTGVPNAGVTTAGKSGTPASTPAKKAPTVRSNPLSSLSSYTYQISLYMITPDALEAFEAAGRTNINDLVAKTNNNSNQITGGAYLILQSGGINGSSIPRAPGFDVDFYIEDLKINSVVSPNLNQAPTVTTTFSFQVYEPYGFSFLSRLKQAADHVAKYSSTLNIEKLTNPSRQFYVLGIRFQGYNSNGSLVTGKELINGSIADPSGAGNGIYESFYPIIIKNINFKIDGKTTVYNISGASIGPDESLNIKHGTLKKQVTLESRTVLDALDGDNGLIAQLNAYEQELYNTKACKIANRYKIEFLGDLENLKRALIVLPSDLDKWKWGWSKAKTTAEINEVTAQNTNPNNTVRTISLLFGTSVFQAVERVISQSTFLSDALKAVYTTALTTDGKTDDYEETKNSTTQTIRWYNLTTRVKTLGFDTQLSQFAYEITYVIAPYETPVVLNNYVNSTSKYYGPVKRYEYWFTGQNTEIINYEQQNNNGYYLVALDPGNSRNNSVGEAAAIPTQPGFYQDVDRTGSAGVGFEAQGAYLTNLFDPKSYSRAKITILGDPDFLMRDSFVDLAEPVYNQFYDRNGRTINPRNGQVFIELDFKESKDYNISTGVLDINDSIVFWQYPESVKNTIKGVSYMVWRVDHIFRQGRFTQELTCSINVFSNQNAPTTSPASSEQRESQSRQQGVPEPTSTGAGARVTGNPSGPPSSSAPTSSGNATTNATGLRPEPEQQPSGVQNPTSSTNAQQTDNENETSNTNTSVQNEGGREE